MKKAELAEAGIENAGNSRQIWCSELKEKDNVTNWFPAPELPNPQARKGGGLGRGGRGGKSIFIWIHGSGSGNAGVSQGVDWFAVIIIVVILVCCGTIGFFFVYICLKYCD